MNFFMNKLIIFIFIFLFFFHNLVVAHTFHYQDFKKIEMEIFKDGKVIGYNYYFFTKEKDVLTIKNQIRFKVNLFGVEVLNVEGYGIEKYKKNKLISFKSKTLQNGKEKFVNLIYNHEKDKFNIIGSSYTGLADSDHIVGNWWNHQILQANSQISPVSGRIKDQIVTFLGKKKIKHFEKIIEVDHFKLTTKNKKNSKDKSLNFDIWYDSKNNVITKVSYSKLGNWEYRLKSYK